MSRLLQAIRADVRRVSGTRGGGGDGGGDGGGGGGGGGGGACRVQDVQARRLRRVRQDANEGGARPVPERADSNPRPHPHSGPSTIPNPTVKLTRALILTRCPMCRAPRPRRSTLPVQAQGLTLTTHHPTFTLTLALTVQSLSHAFHSPSPSPSPSPYP